MKDFCDVLAMIRVVDDSLDTFMRSRKLIVGIASLVIISGFMTLTRSPMPWFDEVYMASIGDSLKNEGRFDLGVNPLRTEPEYVYGPIYPLLQAASFHFLGTNAIGARLPSFIAGIGISILLCALLRCWQVPKAFCGWGAVLVLSSYMFGRGMYSGRMDLVAVFFLFITLFLLEQSRANGVWVIGLAGVSCCAAVLTTPRIAFAIFGLPFVLVRVEDAKISWGGTLKNFLIFLGIGLLGMFAWYLWAFGGVYEALHYYKNGVSASGYVRFDGIVRSPYENHIYIVAGLSPIILLANSRMFNLKHRFLVGGLIGAASGYAVLVRETGPYSSMVVPIYVALIILILSTYSERFCRLVCCLLLSVSLTLFAGKKMVIFSEWSARDNSQVVELLHKHGVLGECVLGDYKYYYCSRSLGNRFWAWQQVARDEHAERAGVTIERTKTLISQTEYAIVDRGNRDELSEFLAKYGFRLVDLNDAVNREGEIAAHASNYDSGYNPVVLRVGTHD